MAIEALIIWLLIGAIARMGGRTDHERLWFWFGWQHRGGHYRRSNRGLAVADDWNRDRRGHPWLNNQCDHRRGDTPFCDWPDQAIDSPVMAWAFSAKNE